ncbi:hypothetical protein T439DRAFT_5050 [Meredithblackwellia eburnea MCA 4105]
MSFVQGLQPLTDELLAGIGFGKAWADGRTGSSSASSSDTDHDSDPLQYQHHIPTLHKTRAMLSEHTLYRGVKAFVPCEDDRRYLLSYLNHLNALEQDAVDGGAAVPPRDLSYISAATLALVTGRPLGPWQYDLVVVRPNVFGFADQYWEWPVLHPTTGFGRYKLKDHRLVSVETEELLPPMPHRRFSDLTTRKVDTSTEIHPFFLTLNAAYKFRRFNNQIISSELKKIVEETNEITEALFKTPTPRSTPSDVQTGEESVDGVVPSAMPPSSLKRPPSTQNLSHGESGRSESKRAAKDEAGTSGKKPTPHGGFEGRIPGDALDLQLKTQEPVGRTYIDEALDLLFTPAVDDDEDV